MTTVLWANFQNWLPSIQSLIQSLLTNTIALAVIAWFAKGWADRRIERLKGEQQQQLEIVKSAQAQKLEQLKGQQSVGLESLKGDISNLSRRIQSDIEQRMLVFKAHFDVEFKSYQEIWVKCDEAADIAAMTLQYAQREPLNDKFKEEERLDSIRRYDVCREALIEVRRKRPFITKEVSDVSKNLLQKCIEITDIYRGCYKLMNSSDSFDRKELIADLKHKIDTMQDIYDNTGELIAKRISELYVPSGQY